VAVSFLTAGLRIGYSLVLSIGQSVLPLKSMKIFIRAFKKRVRRLTYLKIYGMGIHKD